MEIGRALAYRRLWRNNILHHDGDNDSESNVRVMYVYMFYANLSILAGSIGEKTLGTHNDNKPILTLSVRKPFLTTGNIKGFLTNQLGPTGARRRGRPQGLVLY